MTGYQRKHNAELPTRKEVNQLAFEIMSCAIHVHKKLGPGMLEKIYEFTLCQELKHRGFRYRRQVYVPVEHRGDFMDGKLRLDILVEEVVAVELKAVEHVLPVHQAQLMSYMHLLEIPKGLLINFCSTNIIKNTRFFVNEHFSKLRE